MKRIVLFLAHQVVATFPIAFVALTFTDLILVFPRVLGHSLFAMRLRHLMTQGPFFPMEILFAIFLGWYLSRLFQHKEMLWVWVIPLAVMCYLVSTNMSVLAGVPAYSPKLDQSAWSHYFGWGCRPDNACPDQNSSTMLLYISVFYSIGAALGRKGSRFMSPLTEEQFWSTLLVGFLFLLPLIELLFFETAGFFVKNLPGWESPVDMTRSFLLGLIGFYIFMVGPPAAVGVRVIYLGLKTRKYGAEPSLST